MQTQLLGQLMGQMTVLAATSWPDAAIAISGVALVGAMIVVIVWQALTTWRTRIAVSREEAYRELARQTARDLRELRKRLDPHQAADAGDS
jgi:hypothetical protein